MNSLSLSLSLGEGRAKSFCGFFASVLTLKIKITHYCNNYKHHASQANLLTEKTHGKMKSHNTKRHSNACLFVSETMLPRVNHPIECVLYRYNALAVEKDDDVM